MNQSARDAIKFSTLTIRFFEARSVCKQKGGGDIVDKSGGFQRQKHRLMILSHDLAMTDGEFLQYSLVRGTAVQVGL